MANLLSYAFNADVPDNDPTSYAQLMLRMKLAQEMEDKKKKSIQNIGEGIYSAADDFANSMRAQQLMGAIRRQGQYEEAQLTGRPPSGAPDQSIPSAARPALGTSQAAEQSQEGGQAVSAPFSGYGMGMGALGMDTLPEPSGGSRDDIASVLASRYPGPSFNEASDTAAAPMLSGKAETEVAGLPMPSVAPLMPDFREVMNPRVPLGPGETSPAQWGSGRLQEYAGPAPEPGSFGKSGLPAPPRNALDAINRSIGDSLTPRMRAYAALENPAIVSDIGTAPDGRDLTQLAQYYKPPTTSSFPGTSTASPSSQAQPPSLLEHPGPEPTRPPWSADQMQAWRTMNNPNLNPKGSKVEEAKRVFDLHEREREADFTRKHASWQTRSDNYWKDILDQTQKQLDIELKRGTNQPAIQEQWLKVMEAQRRIAKPETFMARGTQYQQPYNPATQSLGPASVTPGAPPPEEEKRSETQARADLFINRVMPDLNKVEHQYQNGKALTGILPNLTQAPMVPGWIGKMVLPEEYKVVNDALGNWAGAFLQQVSGQAVTPSEAMRNLPSMIPQLNDTDQQLADKSRRRRDFTMGAALASGDQGKKMIMDANASYLPVVPFTTREEMMKLPVGQRVQTPDGKIRQVPWHL